MRRTLPPNGAVSNMDWLASWPEKDEAQPSRFKLHSGILASLSFHPRVLFSLPQLNSIWTFMSLYTQNSQHNCTTPGLYFNSLYSILSFDSSLSSQQFRRFPWRPERNASWENQGWRIFSWFWLGFGTLAASSEIYGIHPQEMASCDGWR